MGSPYLYRLRVVSGKKGQSAEQNVIPVYALKAGSLEDSQWYTGTMNLDVLKMITEGSDGARMMTVCTDFLYAYRALENKEVNLFDFHIKDTRVKKSPMEEYRTVATIWCNDMTGGERASISRNQIKMSCEPLSNSLVAVTLAFFDYDGGPKFALA